MKPNNPGPSADLSARAGDVACMAVDGDLRIVGWSETMTDITGVGGDAALGRPCWEVVAGSDERGKPVCSPDCRVAREAWTAGGTPRLRLVVSCGQRRTALEVSTSKALVVGGAALVHVFHHRGLHFTDAGPSAASLTARQREVLVLLGEGLSTAAIAARLGLSKETVRNHVRAVLQELGAHSRLEAVVEARRRGLL
jgi:DNA-binding CsgD family transcriptional regulator